MRLRQRRRLPDARSLAKRSSASPSARSLPQRSIGSAAPASHLARVASRAGSGRSGARTGPPPWSRRPPRSSLTEHCSASSATSPSARRGGAARALEERYQSMCAAMPDLLFRVDDDLRFLEVVASDPSRLALPPESFIGKKIPEVFGESPAGGELGFADPSSFALRAVDAILRATRTGSCSASSISSDSVGMRRAWFLAVMTRHWRSPATSRTSRTPRSSFNEVKRGLRGW